MTLDGEKTRADHGPGEELTPSRPQEPAPDGAARGEAVATSAGGSGEGGAPEGVGEQLPQEPPEQPPAAEAATLEQMSQELARVTEERDRLWRQLQRLQADFDNVRRRARADQERAVEEALGRLVGRLLEVVDNLERALAGAASAEASAGGAAWSSVVSGVRMVYQDLLRALGDEGVQRVAAVGHPFDPMLHQAVERVPAREPQQDQQVLEELRAGYLFRGRLLRPGLVRVAVFQPEGHAGPATEGASSTQTGEPSEA